MNLSDVTHKNFCVAPWTNLHISTKENTKPCCGGNGIVSERLSSDDWNYFDKSNRKLIEIKQELLEGKIPNYCVNCKNERDWYSEFVEQPLVINEVAEFNLRSIDARWNNTCQLSCTYCGPEFSSKWSLLQSKNTQQSTATSYRIFQKNIEKIYQLIADNQIKRVSMLGGEPLLMKENIKLLDILDKSTGIEIFTNLNVVLEDNQLFKQLVQRSNVQWYVSMETIGKKFEFVRRGADWNRQVSNLEQLMATVQNRVTLQSQFCVYSALHLYELYEFVEQYSKLDVNWGGSVTNPQYLNFLNFPKIFKQQSIDQMDQCIKRWPDRTHNLVALRQQLVDHMDNVVPDIVKKCIDWHQQQETKFFNNQFNFVELWPEYCKI